MEPHSPFIAATENRSMSIESDLLGLGSSEAANSGAPSPPRSSSQGQSLLDLLDATPSSLSPTPSAEVSSALSDQVLPPSSSPLTYTLLFSFNLMAPNRYKQPLHHRQPPRPLHLPVLQLWPTCRKRVRLCLSACHVIRDRDYYAVFINALSSSRMRMQLACNSSPWVELSKCDS